METDISIFCNNRFMIKEANLEIIVYMILLKIILVTNRQLLIYLFVPEIYGS